MKWTCNICNIHIIISQNFNHFTFFFLKNDCKRNHKFRKIKNVSEMLIFQTSANRSWIPLMKDFTILVLLMIKILLYLIFFHYSPLPIFLVYFFEPSVISMITTTETKSTLQNIYKHTSIYTCSFHTITVSLGVSHANPEILTLGFSNTLMTQLNKCN